MSVMNPISVEVPPATQYRTSGIRAWDLKAASSCSIVQLFLDETNLEPNLVWFSQIKRYCVHVLFCILPRGENLVSSFIQRFLPTSEDRDMGACIIVERSGRIIMCKYGH